MHKSNMKEETLIMTSDPHRWDAAVLRRCAAPKPLHISQWMPVAGGYVSCFNELIYSNSCSVKPGGRTLSFSHTVCLCHFYISQWSLRSLMLFNECISRGKKVRCYTLVPLEGSGVPRSGVLLPSKKDALTKVNVGRMGRSFSTAVHIALILLGVYKLNCNLHFQE